MIWITPSETATVAGAGAGFSLRFRKDDGVRWQFGVPTKGNANFARVQHLTLTTLRDTLLPKLLSGELSVAELEPQPEPMP